MLQGVRSYFAPTVRNSEISEQNQPQNKATPPWFQEIEPSVNWDRREFLQEPFVKSLIENKILKPDELNSLKRNDLQKLDIAFERKLFEGKTPYTKDQVLSLKIDELMECDKQKVEEESQNHPLVKQKVISTHDLAALDLMQRECFQSSPSVRDLFQKNKLTLAQINSMDVEDFYKFNYKSVEKLFCDGVLTLEQIQACHFLDCEKFNVKGVQEALADHDLTPEQIVWDRYEGKIGTIITR